MSPKGVAQLETSVGQYTYSLIMFSNLLTSMDVDQ